MEFKISLKLLNITLLLIYSTYVFRIIIPLIDYTINYNYIVSELCEQKDEAENTCLGKCHLTKEIKKQSDTPEGNKVLVKIDFLKIPHTFDFNSNTFLKACNKILAAHSTDKEMLLVSQPNLPPPKILVI